MAPECLVPVDLNASAAYECDRVVPQCIFENTLLTTTAFIRIRPPPHYSHKTREDLTATQYKDGLSAVVVLSHFPIRQKLRLYPSPSQPLNPHTHLFSRHQVEHIVLPHWLRLILLLAPVIIGV